MHPKYEREGSMLAFSFLSFFFLKIKCLWFMIMECKEPYITIKGEK